MIGAPVLEDSIGHNDVQNVRKMEQKDVREAEEPMYRRSAPRCKMGDGSLSPFFRSPLPLLYTVVFTGEFDRNACYVSPACLADIHQPTWKTGWNSRVKTIDRSVRLMERGKPSRTYLLSFPSPRLPKSFRNENSVGPHAKTILRFVRLPERGNARARSVLPSSRASECLSSYPEAFIPFPTLPPNFIHRLRRKFPMFPPRRHRAPASSRSSGPFQGDEQERCERGAGGASQIR